MYIPDPRWEEPNLLTPGIKPVGPMEIDWLNPATTGLKIAIVASVPKPVNLVTPSLGVLTSSGSFTGGGIKHTAAQNSSIPINAVSNDAFSIIYIGAFEANAGWDSFGGVFSFPTSSGASSSITLQRSSTTNNLVLYLAASSTTTLLSISGFPRRSALGMRKSSGGNVFQYRNLDIGGNVESLGSSAATITVSTSDPILRINTDRSAGAEGLTTFEAIFFWPYSMPELQFISLMRNPYQFLVPA